MSCIPHLLKLKQESGQEFFKINESTFLEHGGTYKGYDYCVTFRSHGSRCAYVAIPSTSPTIEQALSENEKDQERPLYVCGEIENLHVHGGVSFADEPANLIDDELLSEKSCGDIWIGFDAGHVHDMSDIETMKKLGADSVYLDSAQRMNNLYTRLDAVFEASVKDKYYMENECKRLIDQIIDIDSVRQLS